MSRDFWSEHSPVPNALIVVKEPVKRMTALDWMELRYEKKLLARALGRMYRKLYAEIGFDGSIEKDQIGW
jgi:hypothetical protein